MSTIRVTQSNPVIRVGPASPAVIRASAVGPQGPQGPIGASTFVALTDTPGIIGEGQYLVGLSGNLVFTSSIPAADIAGLATVATSGDYNDLINLPTLVGAFTDLSDTPGTLGTAGQFVVVNGAGTALEFVDSPATPPGGADNQIQFNNAGAFGGVVPLTWDDSNLLYDHGSGGANGKFLMSRANDGNLVTPNIAAAERTSDGIVVYRNNSTGQSNVGFTINDQPIFSALEFSGFIVALLSGSFTTIQGSSTLSCRAVSNTGPGINVTAGQYQIFQPQLGTVDFTSLDSTPAGVRFMAVSLGGSVGFTGPNIAADVSWELPDADGNADDVLTTDGAGKLSFQSGVSVGGNRVVGAVFDANGASQIPGGTTFQVRIPSDLAGNIVKITLLADIAGTAQFNLGRATFANFPTFTNLNPSTFGLTAVQKAEITSFAGWTTALNGEDILEFSLNADTSAITKVTIILEIDPS